MIPDHYQHKCLKTLIPALKDPDALLDEGLFAARVILRLFDEMTGSLLLYNSNLDRDLRVKESSANAQGKNDLDLAVMFCDQIWLVFIAFYSAISGKPNS